MNEQTSNHRLLALGILTFLLLSSASAAGQTESRNLSGAVTDPQHEPLKGAVVQVENDRTTGIVSYITGGDGKYSFKRLHGDTDYQLWVNFRGRKSKVRQLSQFDSHRQKIVNFVLKLH